jgi:hypothetical protein
MYLYFEDPPVTKPARRGQPCPVREKWAAGEPTDLAHDPECGRTIPERPQPAAGEEAQGGQRLLPLNGEPEPRQGASPPKSGWRAGWPGWLRADWALGAMLALAAGSAGAATLTGNLTDISLQPVCTKLVFTPTNEVMAGAVSLSVGGPRVIESAANGAFSLTLEAGDYVVSLPLLAWRKPFSIAVPETNGVVDIRSAMASPRTYTYTNNLDYSLRVTPDDTLPGPLGFKLLTAGGLVKLTNAGPDGATLVLSNSPSAALTPADEAVGAAGQWFWVAAQGKNRLGAGEDFSPECLVLYTSADGLDWSRALAPPVYFEPNHYTNLFGPIAGEAAVQFSGGEFWIVYNFDPYDAGGLAQGLGIARSADLANWSRVAVLYPFGTTNSGGRMSAATWFTDDDGSNYLVGAYGEGAAGDRQECFIIRRLDATFTHWSAPVVLLTTNEFKRDASLLRNGDRYDLYYLGATGGLARATNATLSGVFGHEYNFDELSYALEGVHVLRLGGSQLRMYGRAMGEMFYADSYDNGAAWPAEPSPFNNAGAWHGPGIIRLAGPGTNRVVRLGAGAHAVAVAAPLLQAGQVIAEDARLRNGLVAADGYFLNHVRSTNVSADLLSIGLTNTAPADAATPRAWVRILVGGAAYRVPLYQ